MSLVSINPTTGARLAAYDEMSAAEIDASLAAAAAAYEGWRRLEIADRAPVLHAAAAELRTRTDELARLMALEMGKPLAQGLAEIEKCAATCVYFADRAATLLADEEIATDASRSFVTFRPLGVVLGVMPWNFPFWQAFRYLAPALLAGNASVLKHSSNVTGCALAIEEILAAAGAPAGLFRTLRVGSDRVAALIDDPRVAAVTLTGSTPAGRSVAARAGQALKKTVLELGGSDPLRAAGRCRPRHRDCHLRELAPDQLRPELRRGQALHLHHGAGGRGRTTVCRPHAAEVDGRPADRGGRRTAGARRPARRARSAGAREHRSAAPARWSAAGRRPDPAPSIRRRCSPASARACRRTTRSCSGRRRRSSPCDGEAEALRVANDSPFGLGAAVFTRDVARGTRVAADDLDAGNCFVNGFVRSDARLPFGGIKQSGYGRELSAYGIKEFVNIKTVWVA